LPTTYQLIHNDSPTNAGGVAMYISIDIKFEQLAKFELGINGCEDLWIKLTDCNVILSTIHRHPKADLSNFISAFSTTLQELDNRTFYILDDLNVNVSCLSSNHVSDYLNMLAICDTFQIITKPTRVTDSSSTIIDHILTNDAIHPIIPGVIRTDLSDHYSTFCLINNCYARKKFPIYKRNMNYFSAENYINSLSYNLYYFFSSLPEITAADYKDVFNKFTEVVKDAINKHASVKKLSRKEHKFLQKSCFTNGIKIFIKNKRRLHVFLFLNGNDFQKSEYKKYFNKLTKVKFLAKKNVL